MRAGGQERGQCQERGHCQERGQFQGGGRCHGPLPTLLAVFCLVPLVPDGPVTGVTAVSTPSYFTSPNSTARPAGQVVVLYPYPSVATPEGQLWQAASGLRFRTPGGYFLVPDGPGGRIGFSPAVGYGADTLTARTFVALHDGHPPPETAPLRAALAAQLAAWRVSNVVAVSGPVPQPAVVQFITWLVQRPPTRTGDVDVWDLTATLRANRKDS